MTCTTSEEGQGNRCSTGGGGGGVVGGKKVRQKRSCRKRSYEWMEATLSKHIFLFSQTATTEKYN